MDGGVEFLAGHGRQSAERAGGDVDVLGCDRCLNVRRHQVIFVQLARIQPDAHGVFRAESECFADAIHARQRIFQRAGNIVPDIGFVHAAVFGYQRQHQKDIPRRLGDFYALFLD
jgi:hypothetical protein